MIDDQGRNIEKMEVDATDFAVCVLCLCHYNHCVIMYVIFNFHGLEHKQFYTAQ